MPDTMRPRSIADLPAQKANAPATPAQARARFFNPGNAFNVILPPVPDAVFAEEPAKAMDPSAPTGRVDCDASAAMECPFPATSPLVLASYVRIRAGDVLEQDVRASGIVHYVIEGAGVTRCGDEAVEWGPGDIFITPGGVAQSHKAGGTDAVLWVVNNEPQFAHEHAQAPAIGEAPTPVVHYPAAEIQRQIDFLYETDEAREVPGMALIFSSDAQEESRNALPTLTVALNTLDPGVTSGRTGTTPSPCPW